MMIYDLVVADLGDPMRAAIADVAKFEDWGDLVPPPSFNELVDTLSGGNEIVKFAAREAAWAELTLRRISARDDTETFEKITEEVNVNG